VQTEHINLAGLGGSHPEDPFDIADQIVNPRCDSMLVMNRVMDYGFKPNNTELFFSKFTRFLGYSYVPTQQEIDAYNQAMSKRTTAPAHPLVFSPFEAIIVDLEYGNSTPIIVPNVLASTTYQNGTGLAGSQQFADQKTTTESANWTFSNTLSSSNGLTQSIAISNSQSHGTTDVNSASMNAAFTFAGFTLGGTGSGSNTDSNSTTDTQSSSQNETVSSSISLTNSSTQGISQAQSWSWNTTIPVPPHSIVTASVIVREAKVATNFKATLKFRGVLWFEDNTGGHVGIDTLQWFYAYAGPLCERSYSNPHFHTMLWDPGAQKMYTGYDLDGTFSGQMGIDYDVVVQQSDITPKK